MTTQLAEQLKALLDTNSIDTVLAALGEACIACGEDRVALGETVEGIAYKEMGELLLSLE